MAIGKKTGGRDFTKDDPRINRKGRSPSGHALTDLARLMNEENTTITDSKTKKATELERKRAFLLRVFAEAMNGNMAAAKLWWNYCDGLPMFTGRMGELPNPDEGEADDDDRAIAEHIRALVMGKMGGGRNGNGTKNGSPK